jgi:flagellar hook assembly protein FlgD
LISVGAGRIVSPVRIPRLLLVPVLAASMLVDGHAAVAASDVTVGGTSGTLTFTATSSAPYVQFYFDGDVVGTPEATNGGSAQTAFDSWGYANSSHQVGAADCTDAVTCEPTPSASTDVTLANAAPTITAPTSGAPVFGDFDVTATNPGGGLEFSVHKMRFAFGVGPPYDGHYRGRALSPGTHTVTVTQCTIAGTRCDGPADTVDVVAELQPTIIALAPNPFSPRHRHAVLSYRLQDAENVSITVRSAAGAVVRGPLDLGMQSGGTHSWTWSGNTDAGAVAPSGRYRIVLATSRDADGVTVYGKTAKFVTLDGTAPALGHVDGTGAFYPVHDGYRDTFTASARLSERALVTLHVKTAGGRPVRTITRTLRAGRVALRWDGLNSRARRVAGGTYRWYLTAGDAAGNVMRTPVATVTVSSSRLVTHVVSLAQHGADAVSTSVSDHSCGEANRRDSDYQNGLWLVNGCYQSTGSSTVAAVYRFVVPNATRYNKISATVVGYSLFAPSRVHASYRNAASGTWDDGALVTIRSSRKGLHPLRSISGAQHVGTGRTLTVSIVVDNHDAPCDLDVASLAVQLHYSTLS